MASMALGDEVVDAVTGFTGIITSILEALHEETLYHVENQVHSRWLPRARLVAKVPA